MEVPVKLSMSKGRKLKADYPKPSPSAAPNATTAVTTSEDNSTDAAKHEDESEAAASHKVMANVGDSMGKGAIFSLVKGFMMRGSPVISVEYKEHCEEVRGAIKNGFYCLYLWLYLYT